MTRRKRNSRITVALAAPAIVVLAFAGCAGPVRQAAPTTIAPAPTSQTPVASTAPPNTPPPATTPTDIVACNLFDVAKLNAATGLTWTTAKGANDAACVVTADDGSVITANLSATSGSTQGALSGANSVCTAGTYVPQQIADGGYTCTIGGVPSGGAVYAADKTLVAVSAISTSGADTAHVQQALVALLNSFIAT